MAEMNCVACLYDMVGEEAWNDPDMRAHFVQDGMTACFASKGFGEVRGKGTKGKYPTRPSNLTIEYPVSSCRH